MTKLQVFDPPMCCSSGVCGTNVDTRLVKFLNDVEWLKSKGVEVERFGLAFEPAAFVNNDLVKNTLQAEGNNCLPLILKDNEIVFKGSYPNRIKLAEICGVAFEVENTSQETENIALGCGPDCDCHNSSVDNKYKNAVIVIILLLIAFILFVKFSCKAGANEIKVNNKTQQSQILGEYLNSMSQINKNSKDAAFIFVPAKNNPNIDAASKSAVISTQNILKNKNLKTKLYTLKTSSVDYASIASQVKLPAVLIIGKGSSRGTVSGKIDQTRLLQAYMQASQAGCGASCSCHQK